MHNMNTAFFRAWHGPCHRRLRGMALAPKKKGTNVVGKALKAAGERPTTSRTP